MTAILKHAAPIHPGTGSGQDVHGSSKLTVQEWDGEVGNSSHMTGKTIGMVPTSQIAKLRGARNEVPGEHRNRLGERWDEFKADIAERGIQENIFITVDYGEDPVISEGNHRRDAAVELGLEEVPVEIRFFGKATWPRDIRKHAYKGSQTHSTGTGQEVHGGGGGATRKAPDWRSLNRLRPENDGEIVTDLIAHADASQSVTQMEQKDKTVRKLYERLKGNEAVRKWANKAGPYDALEGDFISEGAKKGRYGDNTLDWIDQQVNAWASMQEGRIDEINAAIGRTFDIPYLSSEVEQLGQDAYDALVNAMYDETQAFLEHSPDRMIFFRGLKGMNYSGELNDSLDAWGTVIDDLYRADNPGSLSGDWPGVIYTDAQLKGRPGASWSASYSTAKEFAQGGVVLMVSVPRSAVLSTPMSGVGALFEDEVVLIDHGQNPITVLSASQTEASFNATEAVVGRKLKEMGGGHDYTFVPGGALVGTVPFPASHNDRPVKIAWSNAVLERFYQDGVWVDTMEDPDEWDEDQIRDEYLS